MGACATKPKVLKADSGEAPAPATEPVPEDTAAAGGAAAETKLENGGDGKATEIVDDDKVDPKSRSLSILFNDQTPPETDKQTNLPSEPEPVPVPEEKSSETNPPEPPHSDDVTDKTTIISDVVETPSEEEKSTTVIESNKEIIGQTIEDHKIKVEAMVNEPIETEKEVKVHEYAKITSE